MTVQEKAKWIRKLQTCKQLYVPFSMATRLPFVICDPESFNDQAHLFVDKEQVVAFVKPYLEEKYVISGMEIAVAQRLSFLINLISIGVNTIVFHDQDGTCAELELTEVIQLKENKNLPENQRPLINPQLQLSAIYFMQAIRRPDVDLEDPKIKELEEEASANAVRAQYLMPVEVLEEEGEDGKKKAKGIKFPYLQNKENNMVQPIFTDGTELKKFVREQKMQILKVAFADLVKYTTKDSYGFAINPLGINMLIRKEQIPAMVKRFE